MAQLASDSEELHQVVSSILRNLSWRADISSKRVLRDIGCVSALMTCALQATKVTKTNQPMQSRCADQRKNWFILGDLFCEDDLYPAVVPGLLFLGFILS